MPFQPQRSSNCLSSLHILSHMHGLKFCMEWLTSSGLFSHLYAAAGNSGFYKRFSYSIPRSQLSFKHAYSRDVTVRDTPCTIKYIMEEWLKTFVSSGTFLHGLKPFLRYGSFTPSYEPRSKKKILRHRIILI
jgi:hypothetical protein